MKKILLLFSFALVTSLTMAQETSYGIKGGLNYAYIEGDDILNVSPTFQYHAGALINIEFTEFFSIQPEFLYSVKGYSSDNVDLNLNYVDVPILLKVKFSDHFSIHAGPQLGYLLSATQKTDISEEDIKEEFKDFDLEVAGGLEYETNSGFSFGARYSFSVASIGDDYEKESTVTVNGVTSTIKSNVEAPDYKNGVIQLFLAFKF